MDSSMSSEWTASPSSDLGNLSRCFCPWQRGKVYPCSHGVKLLWTVTCHMEWLHFKVKVYRIKDFHCRMVQEVAQILIHVSPCLVLLRAGIKLKQWPEQGALQSPWVHSVPTLFQSSSAVTGSGVTAEGCIRGGHGWTSTGQVPKNVGKG